MALQILLPVQMFKRTLDVSQMWLLEQIWPQRQRNQNFWLDVA